MSTRLALTTARDAVTYVACAVFMIATAAYQAGREQYHNYRRWPGL